MLEPPVVLAPHPMKRMTLWRQVTSPLGLSVALLLLAAGLAFGVFWDLKDTVHLTDKWRSDATQVGLDLVRLSESLDGLLLQPRNEPDLQSGSKAEEELFGTE